MYIIAFLFAFLLFNTIILAHEWGHYITALKFGVRVNEFSLGMGPRIFKVKKNDTVYSLRLLPIGGFCAMEGEEKSSDDKEFSFREKKAWQKIIIVSAGAVMNITVGFLLSILVNSFQHSLFGTKISSFKEGSVSNSNGGLRINDEIITINGYKIHIDQDILVAFALSRSDVFDIEVFRNGEFIKLKNVKFEAQKIGEKVGICVDFNLRKEDKNFVNIMNYSAAHVGSTVRTTFRGLVGLIKGEFSIRDMAGPVGVASCIGQITDERLKEDKKNILPAMFSVLSFMMMISVSLGIFNLIPFPALDGGRIALMIPELIFNKKVSEKFEGVFNTVGFSLLMILAFVVTCSDIFKIVKGV